jgi:hypothetical protein
MRSLIVCVELIGRWILPSAEIHLAEIETDLTRFCQLISGF